jgi:pimeloyl-ACP methyl ester carboxylesterase
MPTSSRTGSICAREQAGGFVTLSDLGDGVRLNVIEQGSGKPILLVHGWPTNGRAWKHQLEALSGEHRVLAIDLRGFGDPPPVERPMMALLAQDIRRLFDSFQIEGVLLVGWSMGGCVVMSYCEQFRAYGLRAIGIVDVTPRLLPADDWPVGVGTQFSAAGFDDWSDRWDRDARSVATHVYTMGFQEPGRAPCGDRVARRRVTPGRSGDRDGRPFQRVRWPTLVRDQRPAARRQRPERGARSEPSGEDRPRREGRLPRARASFTPNQAHILVSVAADLRASKVVDVPNVVVTAHLPLDIFVD